MQDLWVFAAIMALGQFSPGPDMLLLTRTALSEGRRAGVLMVIGIVTGLAIHAFIAIGGVASILSSENWMSQAIKYLAAAYLFWLAWGIISEVISKKDDPELAHEKIKKKSVKNSAYYRGLLCNLLNPKAAIFFASVVAPFLTGERPTWWVAALWAIIVFQGLLLWTLWVYLLQIPKIRAGYEAYAKWVDLFFAFLLLGLSGWMLFGSS